MERDAYAIWWYNRSQRPEVDLEQFDDSYIRDIKSQFADAGRKLWVLDVTSDLGVPSYVAIMHWIKDGQENIEFGSGSHFDRRIALLRSLTELNQFLSIGMMGGGTGEKSSLDGVTPLRLEDYPFLVPSGSPIGGARARPPRAARQRPRAGRRLRRDRPARRARFPGARPDPARRRGLGGAGDRSGACGISIAASGRAGCTTFPSSSDLLERPLSESELTPFLPHT